MDVGAKIGQYQVVEHIGRGGMADVWSARDLILGRMVAIKTIARDLSSDANPVKLFEREAKTIANLEHPHILPVYGFGDFQGKLYIVMRYITGGSLEDRLHNQLMSHAEVVATGRAIADSLDHAHSENIVHLDLKPPNILTDTKGVPYLADFGLAAVLGPEGRARNPGSGTLLYMAPEQLTADEIDHRADVYSFSLVLFHMLTGHLPFDGVQPLALQQIQWGGNLPHLGDFDSKLPDELTDILRRGTMANPDERYDSVKLVMEDVEQALGFASGANPTATQTAKQAQLTPFVDILTLTDPTQIERREAEDIYQRARQAWANGNGRFLLSVTHFMVMSDYYIHAEKHDLKYDESGARMLLRGALEYDYHIDHWWEQIENDGRRWVCLHTIRSESPQARIRAFKHLETLPDEDPPQIPIQVAKALSLENDEAPSLAALRVLADRARLMHETITYDVKSSYRGRLLSTVSHEALQVQPASVWYDTVYSPEVDALVAQMALDGVSDAVQVQAARAIGRMRSIHAVQELVKHRTGRRNKALRALDYVLDEAPSLPPKMPFGVNGMAWIRNTGRHLVENPMQIVWAFIFALAGGWLGMGQHIFRIYRAQAIFNQQRILNTVAIGLTFGFFAGILLILSHTLPSRVRRQWSGWNLPRVVWGSVRFLWSFAAAYYISQLLWWAYVWMLLNLDTPSQEILILTGLGTAVGLVLPTLFRMRGTLAFLITTVTTFVVHYIGFQNFWRTSYEGQDALFGMNYDAWIFAYDQQIHAWTIMLPMIALFALGLHFPAVWRDVMAVWRWIQPEKAGPATVQPITPVQIPVPESKPQAEAEHTTAIPPTEEMDSDKLGGASQIQQPDTEPLMAYPATEEFASDKVGGQVIPEADDDSEDEWARVMGEMDNLMAKEPAPPMTEEFASDRVGGQVIPEADDDGEDEWARVMGELDALMDTDTDSKPSQDDDDSADEKP